MNKNHLLSYLSKRMEEKEKSASARKEGPVITISRQVGCGGLQISDLLAAEMNRNNFEKRWQVISKEVLNESAQELKVAPEKVERLLNRDEHFTLDEILAALTDKYYKSNRVILKTVKEVIRNFAAEGNCIILGRAGRIITADIADALHVRLIAPLEWRMQMLAGRRGISVTEALSYIKETDLQRESLQKYFLKDKNVEFSYDLVLDVSRFSSDNVAKIIACAFYCMDFTVLHKEHHYF